MSKDPRVWEVIPSAPSGPYACPGCGRKDLVMVRAERMVGVVRVVDFGTRCSSCEYMRVPPLALR